MYGGQYNDVPANDTYLVAVVKKLSVLGEFAQSKFYPIFSKSKHFFNPL
jgi:hypothetical protein